MAKPQINSFHKMKLSFLNSDLISISQILMDIP